MDAMGLSDELNDILSVIIWVCLLWATIRFGLMWSVEKSRQGLKLLFLIFAAFLLEYGRVLVFYTWPRVVHAPQVMDMGYGTWAAFISKVPIVAVVLYTVYMLGTGKFVTAIKPKGEES